MSPQTNLTQNPETLREGEYKPGLMTRIASSEWGVRLGAGAIFVGSATGVLVVESIMNPTEAVADYPCFPSDPGAYPINIFDDDGNWIGVEWWCPDDPTPTTTTTSPPTTTTTRPPATTTTTTTTRPPVTTTTTTTTTTTAAPTLLTDSDGDGLVDEVEDLIGTDPLDPDMDGDGESDFDELGPIVYQVTFPETLEDLPGFDHTIVIENKLDTDGDGKPDTEESSKEDADEDGKDDEHDPDDNTPKPTTTTSTTTTNAPTTTEGDPTITTDGEVGTSTSTTGGSNTAEAESEGSETGAAGGDKDGDSGSGLSNGEKIGIGAAGVAGGGGLIFAFWRRRKNKEAHRERQVHGSAVKPAR